MAASDLPLRVVGGCGHDAHLVPALRQPGSELGSILADSDEFRGEVQTEDQDFHGFFYQQAKQPEVKHNLKKIRKSFLLNENRSKL